MIKDYEKLFLHLEPSRDLLSKIMRRIRQEERRALRNRLFLFSVFFVGSLITLIPALNAFKADISQSGFPQFVLLLFSDSKIAIMLWQDFVFSVLESLPVLSTMAFLATILVFLSSLKFLARDIKIILAHQ